MNRGESDMTENSERAPDFALRPDEMYAAITALRAAGLAVAAAGSCEVITLAAERISRLADTLTKFLVDILAVDGQQVPREWEVSA
jgi:hypothetical protein